MATFKEGHASMQVIKNILVKLDIKKLAKMEKPP